MSDSSSIDIDFTNSEFIEKEEYKKIIEYLRKANGDVKVKISGIKHSINNDTTINTLEATIDCSLDGQFKLKGLIVNDEEIVRLAKDAKGEDKYQYNKPVQLCSVKKAAENIVKYSIRKLKPEKFLTDSVGSIIFSLCEAARIEPCFNAGVKINSEYSSKYEINKSKEIVDESKKIDFNGYVSDYVQCYKFIYGKKPKELQSVTERKVLTRDDFELFKNICLFVKNGFQKDEKKQSFVTKLINCHDIEDMKNMDCVKNKKHQLSEIARDKNTVDKVVSFIIECSGINFTLEEINEIKKQYEIISEHRKCVNQKHSETPAKKQKRAGNRVFINN